MDDAVKPTILVVDDDASFRKLVIRELQKIFDGAIIEAASGNEAIATLINNSKIHMVICDYNMPDGNGGAVFEYLRLQNSDVVYVLLSSDSPGMHPIFKNVSDLIYFNKSDYSAQIRDLIAQTFYGDIFAATHANQAFGPIRVQHLSQMVHLPVDVYIQLSDKKFVRILKKDDVFDGQEAERFSKKKQKHLFIKTEHVDLFFNTLERAFTSRLNSESTSHQLKIEMTHELQYAVHDIGARLGFTKELESIVKVNVDTAMKLINETPGIKEVIKDIKMDEANYLASHSTILPYIACGIAQQLQWTSDRTFLKLTLASILHDATLNNSDLAKIETEEELKNSARKFSSDEVKAFLDHPHKASAMAARFSNVGADVAAIISQHHEHPDGSGFPLKIKHQKISPLSSLFIIAHEIVQIYDATKANFNIGKYLKETKNKYDVGYFKKVHQCLFENSFRMNDVA